jgi:NADP-dependent 3-hydroxy acid dehydrogenase YdfG
VELRGAVAVVTGASAGLGEATATEFARRGVRVVLAARRLHRLETLANRIERAGGIALAVKCDVTDHAQLDALPSVVAEAVGPCDILVNNAGVPGRGSFEDLDYEQIERVIRVNVLGVLFGTRAFLPGMLKRGRGHVVNVASLAGLFAAPGASVYSASKHAVVAFSESLDPTTKRRGVRVTSVNPGFVPTEGFPEVRGRPSLLTLTPERVAEAIVTVVREEIAPEYSIPRWAAPLQAFRVLTPPLYRWGMDRIARRHET